MSEYKINSNNKSSEIENSNLDIEQVKENNEDLNQNNSLNNIEETKIEETDIKKEIEVQIAEVRSSLDKLEAETEAEVKHKKLKQDYLEDKITYEELYKSVVDINNMYPDGILFDKSSEFLHDSEIKAKLLEKAEKEYIKLKEDFLNDKISFRELQKYLSDLDQLTPDRELCFKNIIFLEDIEIKDKYLRDKEDITQIADYYLTLSFAKWHAAQYKLINNNNKEEAISLIESSIDDRNKSALASPDSFNGDKNYYALATIAYLKKDLESLEEIYSKMTQDKNNGLFVNTQIVGRFIKGLKERGDINYNKDYSGVDI